MNVNRRSQAERTAATRGALVAAARTLFGERGYADVGTAEVVAAAGVTRGALYHHFGDKLGLFHAVVETVESDLLGTVGERVASTEAADPLGALRQGVGVFLDELRDPALRQLLLVDAPAVLGWAEWREIGQRAAVGMVEGLLQMAVDSGQVAPQPLHPVAVVFMGAVDEASLYIANSDDPDVARAEMMRVVDRIISAFVVDRS
ncbi:TetR/AcrR family transcriptional regulator [Jatrophihabitans sp. YIM 134969]